MRRFLVLTVIFLAASALALFPMQASADGLIVVTCPEFGPTVSTFITPVPLPPVRPPSPRPPVPPGGCTNYLSVKNHNVTVTIDNQIAKTHVDETFVNDSTFQLEGTYIFPLPDDATISDMSMWVDGKKLNGQVLDRNQARQIYEEIVRRQRDPALLEYVGRELFRVSIFPIPPKSEKRVEIEYSQVLKAEQGLIRYAYPLNTEKFSPKPLQNVSVNVTVKSNAAIKSIYSPSHNVGISRNGDYEAKVGYEDANVKPDRDFILYYSVASSDIGLNLLTFKSGDGDGFFLMLVAPKVEIPASQVVAKDVILVLDTSGSMQGQKIDQAKRALNFVLDQLNTSTGSGGDRFNIISFSTGTNAYSSALQPASAKNDARNFVSRIRAEGSTDINRALLEAMSMADKDRPTIVIFLTDGLPTSGETNVQKIISNATNATPKNVRLFTFGVGDDVNTILLDSLAEKLRGASGYVRPNEKIDEVVSAFYAKVSTPVLSDITLDWGGMTVNDIYPYPLPDLFAGSQLVVAGRYRNGGSSTVTLKGTVNGIAKAFQFEDVIWKSSGGDDSIPRLWATRKIGYLLNQIRLNGESRELVNEIVNLAVRYGIVTPYTSFLVDERKDVLTEAGRGGAAQDMSKSFSAPGAMPTSGATAVQQSQQQSQLRGANVAPAAPTAGQYGGPSTSATAPLQLVGDKTFLLRNGVWTDSQFDPSRMTTKKIEFNTDAYYNLVASSAAFARFLALGPRVIVVINGVAYETTNDGSGETNPAALPTAAATVVSSNSSNSITVSAAVTAPAVASRPKQERVGEDWSLLTIGVAGIVILGSIGVVGLVRLRGK